MVLKDNEQPIEIPFSLVETGVGTYSKVEVVLPVSVQQNIVFDLDQIEIDTTPAFDPAAAGNTAHQMQFTFNEQAALIPWDNKDVIAAKNILAHASAALLHSALRINDLHIDTRGRANLIARSSIWLGIDSINTTVVFTATGRLIGSLVKLDQKALTQLVLAQLT